MHYAAGYFKVEWKQNFEFDSVLGVRNMERGRSAKYLMWEDEQGREYPMFIVDLLDLLQRGIVHEGITAPFTWTFRKRGQNYGIRLAD